MALYRYSAVREGAKEIFSGEREAGSKHELVEALHKDGMITLSAEAARRKPAFGSVSLTMNIPFLSGVKSADKIVFARNLAAMIKAGLPLSRAVDVLGRQTKSKALRSVITALETDLRQGVPLHSALARHGKIFSPLFIAMARAGEESGTLADALQTAGIQMEKARMLAKKVRGAMIYPAIVLSVMVGVFVLMLIYVVPQLSATFSSLGSALPLPTQVVLGVSNFVLGNSLLLLVGLIMFIAAFVMLVRTRPGRSVWDHTILYIPIIGRIVVKVNCARTSRTLGSLLKAGVSSLTALQITEDAVSNGRFRAVIADARASVEKGAPLSQAFLKASDLYPAMFSEMVAIGEETGDTPELLSRVADFYEAEVEEETKDISTIIEPILMVVIGGGVGFFAIAMIAPIYSLSNAM